MSNARDIADSKGRVFYTSTIISNSGSYTLTAGSSYNIIAIGAGGAGGAAGNFQNVNPPNGALAAQGGGSGAICSKYVTANSDITISISLGAGGIGVDTNTTGGVTTGGSGGATTVTGPSINMSAGGGNGGQGARDTGSGSVSLPDISPAVATGGDVSFAGKIAKAISSSSGYATAQSGATPDRDSPTVSDLDNTGSGVNTTDNRDPIQGILPFTEIAVSSGGGKIYQNSGAVSNTIAGNSATSYGCGGGGITTRSGDSSTGLKDGQGGDGGPGVVVIKEYRNL